MTFAQVFVACAHCYLPLPVVFAFFLLVYKRRNTLSSQTASTRALDLRREGYDLQNNKVAVGVDQVGFELAQGQYADEILCGRKVPASCDHDLNRKA